MTTPTTTAQATVLPPVDAELLNVWEREWLDEGEALSINKTRRLIASHRALTERVRVLAEALRKCDELDTIDEGYGEIAEIARRALAALEGSGE